MIYTSDFFKEQQLKPIHR